MFGKNLVFAAVLCLIAGLAPAAENTVPREGTDAISIPQLINYQGKLTDGSGNPLNGTYSMKFEILDAATGGTSFWNETQGSIVVTGGLFNVKLGSSSPIISLPDGPNCWLEITVGTTMITPRVRLVSVPYTFRAALSEDANKLGGAAAASYATQTWVNNQNFERQANKDVANGYCGLDASAKVTLPKLEQGGATPGQVLGWSGGQWAPVAVGGTGTVTTINAGTGIALTPNPITTTGSVAFDQTWGDGRYERLTNKNAASGYCGLSASGLVDVARGGTGAGTFTANGILLGNGTSAFTQVAAPSVDNTYLRYNTSGGFSWQAVSGGVGGSGTANYGARWTAATTLAAGALRDDGTQIAVGAGPLSGTAVYGVTTTASGRGVYGMASVTSGYGVYGYGGSGTGTNYGAYCYGYGYNTGSVSYGVYGRGYNYTGTGYGGYLYGSSYDPNTTAYGAYCYGSTYETGSVSYGVYGQSSNYSGASYGVFASGTSSSGAIYGVCGQVVGSGAFGVCGVNTTVGGYGVYGKASTTTSNYAGYFSGNVVVTGSLTKGSGSFLIDHPLDPYNKTLRHNFVESPENLCLYRGKIALGADGSAVVEMPSYFPALTKEEDATVNLTSIGRPFSTGYDWNESFTAFTAYGEPGRTISYVVLGDRDDPAIHLLGRPVEEYKTGSERGALIHPEAYQRYGEFGRHTRGSGEKPESE